MRTDKDVKLSDIAEKFGVSVVTVSNALNNRPGVSDKLRSRIVAEARRRHYEPPIQKAAEKTASGSYAAGVVVAEKYLKENSSFYWKLYQRLSQEAFKHSCVTTLELIGATDEKALKLPGIIESHRADGLIALGAFSKEYMNKLTDKANIPVVSLDATADGAYCDSVVSNNIEGGRAVTEYLFSMGHTDIGFVGTLHITSAIDDRFLGFVKALMEHGRLPHDKWILEDRDKDKGIIDPTESMRFDESDMPTAFFCNCDETALNLIRKLETAGYKVPEDISVAGFDNYLSEPLDGITLTTYETDMDGMVERALKILLDKIGNKGGRIAQTVIPGQLIEGNSVRKLN